MNKRQRRTDIGSANAVVRGINILTVRNRSLAQSYMAHKRVPAHVIARALDHPSLRRRPSAAQAISEALMPGAAVPLDE